MKDHYFRSRQLSHSCLGAMAGGERGAKDKQQKKSDLKGMKTVQQGQQQRRTAQ